MFRIRIAALIALLTAAACSSTTGPGGDNVASIRFGVDTLSMLQGETQQVVVKVYNSANRELAVQPTLVVDAASSAPVSLVGLDQIRADRAGSATLRATAGSVSAELPILVFGHPTGNSMQSRPLGLRPYGVAVGRDFAYVTQLDGRSVTRLSLFPFDSVGKVNVGSVPTGISLNRRGTMALVTNQHDPSVGIVDAATNTQTTALPASTTTFRTIFSPSGTHGYATLSGGELMVIDMASRTATAKLPIVSAGNGIAFAPGDTLLYISSMFGGISVVNTKTNTVIRTIQLFGTLQDVAISKDGTELYVAREDVRAIEVLALPAGTRTTSITVSAPVFGLSLTPDGAQLWAAHTATGVVSIIDRAERTVVRALFVAGSPRRIAFDRLGTLAVVSNEWGGVHLIR